MDDSDRPAPSTDGPDPSENPTGDRDPTEKTTDGRDLKENPTDGGDLTENPTDGGDLAGKPTDGVDLTGKTTNGGDLVVMDGGGRACGALGDAIAATLGGVMRDFDARADGVCQSQEELSLSLNRLTLELDKLLEDAPTPLIMQQAAKISSIRRRVSAMNLLLKSIQRRIDYIDRTLSAGNVAVAAGTSATSKLT